MTPLVCGDDVQPRRKAEADSTNEWIREAHSREIDVGVRPQKRPHFALRCKERRDCVVECWRRPRPDSARSLRFEAGFHRWFEILHERPADETRPCGTTPPAAIAARSSSRWLHRAEVDAVGGAEVVEAFGDAPRALLGAPGASCLSQSRNESARVAFCRVQRLVQSLNIGRQCYACLCVTHLAPTAVSAWRIHRCRRERGTRTNPGRTRQKSERRSPRASASGVPTPAHSALRGAKRR
jgi:hypothetical protein